MPTPPPATDRKDLIDRYAASPAALRGAVAATPPDALNWRPAPGKWSIVEIVLHCQDSEVVAHGRLRYVLAEKEPVLVGYDQDLWATTLDYAALPIEPALQAVEGVHAATAALLRRLPDAAFAKVGHHTESGAYSADKWLRTYAKHLEDHVAQIGRNVAAWEQAGRPKT